MGSLGNAMTSGIFHSTPISSITILDRQRRELKGIEDLADSIRRLGLIHPIVLTRDLVLVAGQRRLEACRSLGWTSITFQYMDEADETSLTLVELEENIKRDNLPWPDQIETIRRLHETYKSLDPTWTQEKTAAKSGWSPQAIAEHLLAADSIKRQPEIKKKSLSSALHVERTLRKQEAERVRLEIEGHDMAYTPSVGPILNADFLEWAPIYDGPPFNFIHCDFPYGIESDKFHQGATQIGSYEDTDMLYWKLVDALRYNIISSDGHIIFWFAMRYYNDTKCALEQCGWTVYDYPLVWLKSDNAGVLPDPRRGYRQIYETAFFGYRGDAKVINPKSNAIASPSTKLIHPHEKPVPVLNHFFEAFVNGNTRLLDPTAGGGTALQAAYSIGVRHIVGLERDPEFARRANDEFRKATGYKL